MMNLDLQNWVNNNLILAISGMIAIGLLLLLLFRYIVARGLIRFASHTATKIDDILLKHMHPYRIAWLASLGFFYACATLLPAYQSLTQMVCLILIMWLVVVTINALLNALNEIYEKSPSYTGVSIQSYLDLTKILLIIVALVLSISLITGKSPVVILTGLGAITAVLLLIFHDTILAMIASIQIVAHELVKEGDWIEVPGYEADGDVVNISLHTIKVQNFDKTFTIIPTYKIVDTAYRNWRGMKESGGRRIKRAILLDMTSIKFCDPALLDHLCKIDLIQGFLSTRMSDISAFSHQHAEHYDFPLDGPQITNVEVFRAYIVAYLKNRPDIHQTNMPFLIRTLEPTPKGLPIELYIFTLTTVWEEYENIQSTILEHLLAAAEQFDLRVFQEPTGKDFSRLAYVNNPDQVSR